MGDKRKMDKPRALSLMGFSTSRQIGKIFFFSQKKNCDFMSFFSDAHFGKPEEIREVLDKALFERTQQMMHGAQKKAEKQNK